MAGRDQEKARQAAGQADARESPAPKPEQTAHFGSGTMLDNVATQVGPASLERRLQLRLAQRRAAQEDRLAADTIEAAERGFSGSGQALPHLDRIQQAFGGQHDLRAVQAYVGGPAADAADRIQAQAYASGTRVAFREQPDLHTAAHEAAHVVQQRGGVSLHGGVGREGDPYEQQADAVADRVVAGDSAEALLDTATGATQAHAVQKKERVVSSKAGGRLEKARAAIEGTKAVMSFGAGNQWQALKASNFNSYFRIKAMRDATCWEIADAVKPLADANPEALAAAKADLAHGGNCGEHAAVAFDFLRVHASGEILNGSAVAGLDHAFVIIGDLKGDTDADLVVADPWPTQATATTWDDHFAFTPDRKHIHVKHSMTADGQNPKAAIAAGLKLSAKGLAMINQKLSDEETREELESGSQGDHPWIWNQPDAAATGHLNTYRTAPKRE